MMKHPEQSAIHKSKDTALRAGAATTRPRPSEPNVKARLLRKTDYSSASSMDT